MFLLGTINLLLIDEIHHIGEERGATLEMIVMRMRNMISVYNKRMQEIHRYIFLDLTTLKFVVYQRSKFQCIEHEDYCIERYPTKFNRYWKLVELST